MNTVDLKRDMEENCRFCNPPDRDRILYETDNFYVMLSLGPIVEGYLLICSKQHFESCGLIPQDYGFEFDLLADSVKKVLTAQYGSCIFFEHGRAGSCLQFHEGSKHCYHAHMHCLPVNIKLNNQIRGTLAPIHCETWEEFRKFSREYNEPYLFVDDGEKQIHIVVKEIRRQYLRYLTAKVLGQDDLWNWVEHQGWEKIFSAKKKLTLHFNNL